MAATSRVALVDAVKNGDLARVRMLVAQKVDVNAAERDGTTALHWAAHLGDVTSADLLIKAGANVKAVTRDGATPFGLACYKGNAAVITRLLAAGEDPNAIVTGEPVIMMAARAGDPDAIRSLLAKGANPNVTESNRGQTALMWAASEGNVPAMKVLIEAGANVRARSKGPGVVPQRGGRIPRVSDPVGLRSHRDPSYAPNMDGLQFSPIMWAARDGRLDAVRLLLDSGADVNDEKPDDGTTVLILAIMNRHYELAGYLLGQGANPNRGPGYTALHQLVWTRRLNLKFGPFHPQATGNLSDLDLAAKLIEKGVRLDAQATKSFRDGYRNRFNRVGATAFLMAAKLVDVPMMRLLVSKGADIGITNEDGDSPLGVAAGIAILNPGEDPGTEAEVMDSVRYLVEDLHVNVNHVNKNGENALHGAAYRGLASVAQYLIQRGIALELTNVVGWKPVNVSDGVFFAGFFKAQPHVSAVIREAYKNQGLAVPPPPRVNDTSLLTIGAKYKVGDVVELIDVGKYRVVPEAEIAAGKTGLLRVTAVDSQSQVARVEDYAR